MIAFLSRILECSKNHDACAIRQMAVPKGSNRIIVEHARYSTLQVECGGSMSIVLQGAIRRLGSEKRVVIPRPSVFPYSGKSQRREREEFEWSTVYYETSKHRQICVGSA